MVWICETKGHQETHVEIATEPEVKKSFPRIADMIRRTSGTVLLIVLFEIVGLIVAYALTWSGNSDVVLAACVTDIVCAAILMLSFQTEHTERHHLNIHDVILLMALLAVTWVVGVLCATSVSLLTETGASSGYTSYEEAMSTAPQWEMLLLSCVLAPICEETLCRKTIFLSLREFGCVYASVVSACLFAIMHGTLVHIPFTFALGLLCCLIMEMTGSLVACMAAHAAANIASIVIAPLITVQDWMLSPIFCSVCFAALCLVMLVMLGRSDSHTEEV